MILAVSLRADTYTLTDGTQVSGDPVSPYKDEGVVFKSADGSFSARVGWDKFTQDSIRKLRDNAKTAVDKDLVDPLIETTAEDLAKRKEITVRPVELPERVAHPAGFAGLFASPVGWFLLLVVYGATIYAAFEVAVYRGHNRNLVCGLAAVPFFGVLSPILFLAIPPKAPPEEALVVSTETATQATPNSSQPLGGLRKRVGESAPPPPQPVAYVPPVPTMPGAETPAPVAIDLPPTVTYTRGETSFNRRFFETKLAGFFRLVPSPADADLRIHLKSARGDFVGRRIIRITPTELYLQVGNENATADEMIPFTDIFEVQVRHKDLA
jgi:hypothetical protein